MEKGLERTHPRLNQISKVIQFEATDKSLSTYLLNVNTTYKVDINR